MQSAKQGTSHWQIDWDTLQGAGRWENELMGWGSTADYMQGTSMRFRTREAAIHFAEKQGWSYQVDKVQEARIPPKSYGQCQRFGCSASSLRPLQRGPHAGAETGSVLIIGVHPALTRSSFSFPLIPWRVLFLVLKLARPPRPQIPQLRS